MSDVITHGSLFSGIGGFDDAGELCGMKTVWVCEIEPAPVAILKRHFPDAILTIRNSACSSMEDT